MGKKKTCRLRDYYKKTWTLKCVIIWDILRVAIPIFYFVISLIIYINDDNKSDDNNDNAIISSSSIIPSSTKAAENSNDQLVSLSFLLGEIFRTFLICLVAIIALCKNFDYMPTGTYFWTRSINSWFNVMSHLFQFLILGANVFRLVITTGSFLFDGYLSYVVFVFWQNLKQTKNSTASSSGQSEFSQQVEDEEWVNDRAKQLEEEIKAGLANDVLEVDEYDENGIPHTKAIRIDEENKQVVVEWVLPPLKELNAYKSREASSRDNASRITAFLEDGRHPRTRKASYDDDMRTSTYYKNKPSFKGKDKKDFEFTSNHIQMVEKSKKDEESNMKFKMNRTKVIASKHKLISKKTGSENQWMNQSKDEEEEEIEADDAKVNESVSSVKDYVEPEIYLDTNAQTLNIKKNFWNSPSVLQKKMSQAEDEIRRTKSKDQVQSTKSFKFTSQMECIEKNDTYDDANHFSNSFKE